MSKMQGKNNLQLLPTMSCSVISGMVVKAKPENIDN